MEPGESEGEGRSRRGLLPLAAALAGALDRLFFPPGCPGCGAPAGGRLGFCAGCWSALAFVERPFCEVTGLPFAEDQGPGALSAEAIADPPPFARLRAAVLYGPLAGRLAARLKYGDRLDLVPLLAGLMARAGAELLAEADLVVPVPLHPARLRRRRFNQSAELARRLARDRGLPFAPMALARVKATRPQVGLGAAQRRDNVGGAFRVPAGREGARVMGARVLLVDDVFTTGATMREAARALLKGGASAVDALVFARVAAGAGAVHIDVTSLDL